MINSETAKVYLEMLVCLGMNHLIYGEGLGLGGGGGGGGTLFLFVSVTKKICFLFYMDQEPFFLTNSRPFCFVSTIY